MPQMQFRILIHTVALARW